MKKGLKKFIAAIVVIGTFGLYIFTQRSNTQNPAVATTENSSSSSPTTISISPPTSKPAPNTKPKTTPTPAPAPTPTPAQKPVAKGAFNDGTYTGTVEDAYFGNVQVQAVITNGKLSDVIFLQYPQDRSTSLRKSQMSMPILKSEVISAQSSKVDTVSGATATSMAFSASIQSALDHAKT